MNLFVNYGVNSRINYKDIGFNMRKWMGFRLALGLLKRYLKSLCFTGHVVSNINYNEELQMLYYLT